MAVVTSLRRAVALTLIACGLAWASPSAPAEPGPLSAAACVARADEAAAAHDPGAAALWRARAQALDPSARSLAALSLGPASFASRRAAFLLAWPLAWILLATAWGRPRLRLPAAGALVVSLALGGSLLWTATRPAPAVLQSSATLRRGDGEAFGALRELPAGLQLQELESSARAPGWVRVRLADGEEGWIPDAAAERVFVD